MSDAVLGIAAELSVEPVLQKLVHAARGLAGARYAAIGIPDGSGGFARFLTSGMSEQQIEAIGPLPRTHGLLGAMLEDPAPFRTADIRTDPRFWGWPSAHPAMGSFLGVPIVAKGDVVGAFYLTDKLGAAVFSDRDQELIQLLAAHAAIALENARLFERSREASVLEERERLARELHDAMSQTLFSLTLTAESAASLVHSDPDKAEAQIRSVQGLAREIAGELRTLVLELRPAQLAADGLVATLRTHVEVLRRARGIEVDLEVEGEGRLDPAVEPEVLRIVQEALHNALRHAHADRVRVRLALDGRPASVIVSDDGNGFDPRAPGVRSRRLGLTSMRERAAALGGRLTITSERGKGTEVRWSCPMAEPIRVLIVDDHPVVRQGLRTFLESRDGIDVVGEAADGHEAVGQASALQPDVVLLDLMMPGMGGVAALQRMRSLRPEPRVLVITSFGSSDQVLAAVRAGAAGYLLKDAEPRQIESAIRAAHRGEPVLHPTAAAVLMEQVDAPAPPHRAERLLTPRELEVLRLLAQGLSNRELAARLVVSEKTVKTHVSSLLAKLRLADRTQAALYAVREGLVDPTE